VGLLSNQDAQTGWRSFRFDAKPEQLPDYLGRQLGLQIVGQTNGSAKTDFFVDSLSVQACP
jgi:hypothetical protein